MKISGFAGREGREGSNKMWVDCVNEDMFNRGVNADMTADRVDWKKDSDELTRLSVYQPPHIFRVVLVYVLCFKYSRGFPKLPIRPILL